MIVGANCVTRTEEKVQLFTRSGDSKTMCFHAKAMSMGRDETLVATDGEMLVFDSSGEQVALYEIGPGVTAMQRTEDHLALGYRDGKVELLPADVAGRGDRIEFTDVPASPVTRIVEGPGGTFAVGHADGSVGLWEVNSGRRLSRQRLYGPVSDLILSDGKLVATSELGDHLMWDLSVYHIERCELLRRVWEAVPVVWERGRAVVQPPPALHECAPK
jgi:WD40 repeat protein